MNTFIKKLKLTDNLFAVFEDEGETGYLYSYSPQDRRINLDLIIYQREPRVLEPSEKDVRLLKKNDSAGVYVWDKLRGYIVFPHKKRERLKFKSADSPGISNSDLPELFTESEDGGLAATNDEMFIEDRKKYWKELAEKIESGTR